MKLPSARGFTLIELVISIAILGILVALGIPSFSEWIHNTQLRNAAESALNGLQIARSEAVRRNGYTQFILGPGSGWRVISITPPSGGVGAACQEIAEIQRRDASEGSSSATVAVTPVGVNSVTFTPLGWVGSGTTSCGNPITQLDIDSSVLAAGRSRELRIVITAGGGIRLCDPQVAAGDPRSC
ncbi:MAG: GspH/FimT family pseudopilin [Rhodocyclaceae bacterium]